MIVPVILSGGAGVRLWPESRVARPKPFLKIDPCGQSLLQQAVERSFGLQDAMPAIIVTGHDYLFQSLDELKLIKKSEQIEYLLESTGRNTGPAVLLAVHHVVKKYGAQAKLLILAADHLIREENAFQSAVSEAAEEAERGHIVTFGLRPTHPETGYGYLKLGQNIAKNLFEVERFVEKPDASSAAAFLKSNNYLWNSGMFCFRCDVISALAERESPNLFKSSMKCYENGVVDTGIPAKHICFSKHEMERMEAVSVDYALMEKASSLRTVACDLGWSDVGAWNAVWENSKKDADENSISGNAVLVETQGSLIRSQERVIATLGVKNLLVIDTPDALLVADRARAQDVKKAVEYLKKDYSNITLSPKTAHRPWGTYTVLAEGNHYKVKRIEVKIGGRLSLQRHAHRSEHWVVVSGTAKVTNGENVLCLHPNESTYISVGVLHRLENVGLIPLVIIEVQSGEYLGEDDIERLEDVYNR